MKISYSGNTNYKSYDKYTAPCRVILTRIDIDIYKFIKIGTRFLCFFDDDVAIYEMDEIDQTVRFVESGTTITISA